MMRAVLLASLALFALPSLAQSADVTVNATVSWVAPTKDASDQPLTSVTAVTGYDVFQSLATIPDNATIQPVASVPASQLSYTWSGRAAVGATLYFRVKAKNVGGSSAYSAQATKLVSVTVPAAPAGSTITIVITISP